MTALSKLLIYYFPTLLLRLHKRSAFHRHQCFPQTDLIRFLRGYFPDQRDMWNETAPVIREISAFFISSDRQIAINSLIFLSPSSAGSVLYQTPAYIFIMSTTLLRYVLPNKFR